LVRGDAQIAGSDDRKTQEKLERAMAVADFIQVDVYRPGTGSTPEASQGVGFPTGTDSVEVNLSVIAEPNKRVAVRLFEAGKLVFLGVDEDVDVVTNQNTRVNIQAFRFEMSAVAVVTAGGKGRAWQDEGFLLAWQGVNGVDGYHLEVSTAPDFSTVAWDTLLPDTFLVGMANGLPSGDYFFRVAGHNKYATSEWSVAQLHIAGAPVVTGISVQEILRGTQRTFTIYGSDLDHPSRRVEVFGQQATIQSPVPVGWNWADSMLVQVTPGLRAFSDFVTVSNTFGSNDSPEPLRIQAIAYVTGDLTPGDDVVSNVYKVLIDQYGGTSGSALYIMPFDRIDAPIDMRIFDVVIVGWDTGTSEGDWGGGGLPAVSRAASIAASGASIMGMGIGGAAYFELAGLDIGIRSCVTSSSGSILAVDPAAQIFTKPNPMDVSANLYFAVGQTLGVDNPSNNVIVYGQGGAGRKDYPLADEPVSGSGAGASSNFLWGFHSSSLNLTSEGVAMLENVVTFLFEDGTKDVTSAPE